MTSTVSGTSSNPPPFPGEQACPFLESNSLNPDKHLVVPFCNVATQGQNGFAISDFTVEMELVLEPEGVSASGLQVEWEVAEARPQMSGSLIPLGGLAARFANPKQGGVYRFRSRVNGSPWTEGNVVLPLSGAEVSSVFEADFAVYSAAISNLNATVGRFERQLPTFGVKWFNDNGAVDYLGRVDNAGSKTVWTYNKVNDISGQGAVATFYGVPTRMAKLGNFLAGYGTERLGIWGISQWLAQGIGAINDATATMSWDAGTELAEGGIVGVAAAALSTGMWGSADSKERRLWPNHAAADNHALLSNGLDFNLNFCSPGVVEGRIR